MLSILFGNVVGIVCGLMDCSVKDGLNYCFSYGDFCFAS